jgi:GntR family transcriptional regulator / MocR family aminotransferase
MQLALEIDLSASSLQTQVFSQIHGLIMSGRLQPGTRLPGSRALSEQLGVSRNTIILAYETLTAEGYLESRGGAGTYVARTLPDRSMSSEGGLRSPALLNPIQLFLPVAEPTQRTSFPRELVYDFAKESSDSASFPKIGRAHY